MRASWLFLILVAASTCRDNTGSEFSPPDFWVEVPSLPAQTGFFYLEELPEPPDIPVTDKLGPVVEAQVVREGEKERTAQGPLLRSKADGVKAEPTKGVQHDLPATNPVTGYVELPADIVLNPTGPKTVPVRVWPLDDLPITASVYSIEQRHMPGVWRGQFAAQCPGRKERSWKVAGGKLTLDKWMSRSNRQVCLEVVAEGKRSARAIVQLTDLAVTLRYDLDVIEVLITSISSGLPVTSQLVLLGEDGQEHWVGSSDAGGMARVPGVRNWSVAGPMVLRATSGDDVVHAPLRGEDTRAYLGSYQGGQVPEVWRPDGLMTSGRRFYKPGEQVIVQGLARRVRPTDVGEIPDAMIDWTVTARDGEPLVSRGTAPMRSGGFSLVFDIPPGTSPGTMRVRTSVPGIGTLGHSLEVVGATGPPVALQQQAKEPRVPGAGYVPPRGPSIEHKDGSVRIQIPGRPDGWRGMMTIERGGIVRRKDVVSQAAAVQVDLGGLEALAPEVTVTVMIPRVKTLPPVFVQRPIKIPQRAHQIPLAVKASSEPGRVLVTANTEPGALVQGLCVDAALAVEASALSRFWHPWSPSAVGMTPGIPALPERKAEQGAPSTAGPMPSVPVKGVEERSLGNVLRTTGYTTRAGDSGQVRFVCTVEHRGTVAVMVNSSVRDRFGFVRKDVAVAPALTIGAPYHASAGQEIHLTAAADGTVGARAAGSVAIDDGKVQLRVTMPDHDLGVQVACATSHVTRIVQLQREPAGAAIVMKGPGAARVNLKTHGASGLELVVGNSPLVWLAVPIGDLLVKDSASATDAADRLIALASSARLAVHLSVPQIRNRRDRHNRTREAVQELLLFQQLDGGFGDPEASVNAAIALLMAREAGVWISPRPLERALRHLHRYEHHLSPDVRNRNHLVATAWYARRLGGDKDPVPSSGTGPFGEEGFVPSRCWEVAAALWARARDRASVQSLQSLVSELASMRTARGDWGDDTTMAVLAISEYARVSAAQPSNEGFSAWLNERGVMYQGPDAGGKYWIQRIWIPAGSMGVDGSLILSGPDHWWASVVLTAGR